MKCGQFPSLAKHRITIQVPTETADDYGGFNVTWSTLEKIYAWIVPMSGREVYTNDKLTSRVTHKIVIRYINGLRLTDTAAKHRVQFDGKTLEIETLEDLDEDLKSYGNVFQRLMCVENGAGNAS